jgi:hypothetical protein
MRSSTPILGTQNPHWSHIIRPYPQNILDISSQQRLLTPNIHGSLSSFPFGTIDSQCITTSRIVRTQIATEIVNKIVNPILLLLYSL